MREEERDFSLRVVKVCLGYSQVSVNSVEGAGDQITFPVPGDVGTTPYCWRVQYLVADTQQSSAHAAHFNSAVYSNQGAAP